MFPGESDTYFRRLNPASQAEMFLYIGEVKAEGLNAFVAEALARRHGKPFEAVSLVPDILGSYPGCNVLALNSRARALSASTGRTTACRMPPGEFAAAVSCSPDAQKLVRDLLRKQGRLFVHVFESAPELAISGLPGVSLLAPAAGLAALWNNKLYQFHRLKDDAPLVEYRICAGADDVAAEAAHALRRWPEGVFVSQAYSAAGGNSFVLRVPEELERRLPLPDSVYFISRYIPHDFDPTVLGVVANGRDVYIAGLADQQIEGGNQFRGSSFPSLLPAELQREAKECTRQVGRVLGKSGYRGIFGCDYVVDGSGRLFFVEVNARKQGTTMEMCCTLENLLPPGAPTLMDIEHDAIVHRRLPDGCVELETPPGKRLCWRTYNVKTDRAGIVCGDCPAGEDERELFRKTAAGETDGGSIVLEHVGRDIGVTPGMFLGRAVAVARDPAVADRALAAARRRLTKTLQYKKESENETAAQP